MKLRINISESAIPLSIYRKWKGHGKFDRDRYSDLFRRFEGDRNAYRIYLPVTGVTVAKKISVLPEIEDAVAKKGYTIDDYRAGIAVDTETGRRKVRIGKLLSDDPALLKLFNNDKQRQASRLASSDMLVVISRHPYDIAGMSTGRSWRSCTRLTDGKNQYTIEDVKHGTLVAYLVKADDKNIENPIARVRIYRFNLVDENAHAPRQDSKGKTRTKSDLEENGEYILMREPRVYGTPSPQFVHVIDKWLGIVNEGRADGLYCVHKDVYVDTLGREVVRLSNPDNIIRILKKGQKLPEGINISEEARGKAYDAVVNLLLSTKDDSDSAFKKTSLNTIIRLAVPVDRCRKFIETITKSVPIRTLSLYSENIRDPIGFDIAATLWHQGFPLKSIAELMGRRDVNLDAGLDLVRNQMYIPSDIEPDAFALAFFLASYKSIPYRHVSSALYRIFASTIPLSLEQRKKFPDDLSSIIDDWLDEYYVGDYEEASDFLKRVYNMYNSLGRPISDRVKNILLNPRLDLNIKAAYEAGLIDKDTLYNRAIARFEGDQNFKAAYEVVKDSPVHLRKLKDAAFDYALGSFLKDKFFVSALEDEDLPKMGLDPIQAAQLAKMNPKLDVGKYVSNEAVENFIIGRLVRYIKPADWRALKKIVKKPGPFLDMMLKAVLEHVKKTNPTVRVK